MKEKCLNILSVVANLIKEHKKIVIGVVVAIVAIIVLANIISNSGKPSKYEDKIKTVTKALSSESKMKKALGDVIDVKGAAAWQEADQKAGDFKKEYKDLKKDSDEIEDMEDALKAFAESNEDNEFKVKGIKEPKKNSKNNKIYTVAANFVVENFGIEDEIPVKFVFYKGKIIDIIQKNTDTSYFETALKLNKSNSKSSTEDEDD